MLDVLNHLLCDNWIQWRSRSKRTHYWPRDISTQSALPLFFSISLSPSLPSLPFPVSSPFSSLSLSLFFPLLFLSPPSLSLFNHFISLSFSFNLSWFISETKYCRSVQERHSDARRDWIATLLHISCIERQYYNNKPHRQRQCMCKSSVCPMRISTSASSCRFSHFHIDENSIRCYHDFPILDQLAIDVYINDMK